MHLVYRKNNFKFLLLLIILCSIILSYTTFLNAQGAQSQRDPFISLADKVELSRKPEKEVTPLPFPVVVSGIIWTEKVAVAVLNGEVVQEGQQWFDFMVEKIERNKVVLRLGETIFELPFISEEEEQEGKPR